MKTIEVSDFCAKALADRCDLFDKGISELIEEAINSWDSEMIKRLSKNE